MQLILPYKISCILGSSEILYYYPILMFRMQQAEVNKHCEVLVSCSEEKIQGFKKIHSLNLS